jgi:hypothetical protein
MAETSWLAKAPTFSTKSHLSDTGSTQFCCRRLPQSGKDGVNNLFLIQYDDGEGAGVLPKAAARRRFADGLGVVGGCHLERTSAMGLSRPTLRRHRILPRAIG